MARQVWLRHERFYRRFVRGGKDLRLPVRNVAPDHRVGHIRIVLLDEPVEDSRVVEGHVNRIKMLKRQMFGRAGLALLRKRVLLYS